MWIPGFGIPSEASDVPVDSVRALRQNAQKVRCAPEPMHGLLAELYPERPQLVGRLEKRLIRRHDDGQRGGRTNLERQLHTPVRYPSPYSKGRIRMTLGTKLRTIVASLAFAAFAFTATAAFA